MEERFEEWNGWGDVNGEIKGRFDGMDGRRTVRGLILKEWICE